MDVVCLRRVPHRSGAVLAHASAFSIGMTRTTERHITEGWCKEVSRDVLFSRHLITAISTTSTKTASPSFRAVSWQPPALKPDEQVATTRWQAFSVLCFPWSSRSRGVARHERRPPVTEPRLPSTSRLILPTSDGWETRNGHRDGLLRSCVAQFPRGFGKGSCGQQEQ